MKLQAVIHVFFLQYLHVHLYADNVADAIIFLNVNVINSVCCMYPRLEII